jgi:TolA-binding protein
MADWKPPELRIRVPWDDAQAAAVARRVFDPPPRRRVRGYALGYALAALAVCGLFALGWSRRSSLEKPPPPAEDGTRRVRFHDGSLALLHGSGSDLRVDVADDSAIVTTLVAGQAQFDVVPRPRRVFRVHAGDTVVEVLGTAFAIDRLDGLSRVTVTRGRVRVSWPGGAEELVAGASGVFPPDGRSPPTRQTTSAPGESSTAERPPEDEPIPTIAAATPAAPAARAGDRPDSELRPDTAGPADSRRGSLSFAQASPSRVADSVDELLRAADAANLSARPREAVEALERIVREHARDGRAAMAAFMLGRLWMDDLASPARAAASFAHARELAPRGPLVEDTYLREVEAWMRAGQPDRAAAAARAYLTQFQDSPRARQVRRAAGLR